jgi:hypothetical protein
MYVRGESTGWVGLEHDVHRKVCVRVSDGVSVMRAGACGCVDACVSVCACMRCCAAARCSRVWARAHTALWGCVHACRSWRRRSGGARDPLVSPRRLITVGAGPRRRGHGARSVRKAAVTVVESVVGACKIKVVLCAWNAHTRDGAHARAHEDTHVIHKRGASERARAHSKPAAP